MDITIKEPSDSRDDEREKSPSPEPFKEPEGMVTIDLDRKSPSPLPQPALDDLKKPKSNDFKHLSLTMLLALLCLFSFAAAIAIHWDDIGWISKQLTHVNENQSLQPVPTPAPLQVPQTTITLDMETCPVDPQEEFRIHLIVCERTRNFEDCCHNHLRSRLPKINDVCSILEMLDLLVEFKKLFLRRTQRDVDIEYKEDDYRKEKEKKEQEKMRTKEKILSYIRHLNKPLQREIPALFDWFGDLFLEYQDEFGNDGKKDDATKEYVPQQAPGIIENEESNYDSPSERVLILEQKQGVEDRRQSNSTQEIDRSISRKKTLDSTDEELFENRTTTSLDFIMNRTSTEKVEINQTSQNLPSTLAEQLEPSDENLNQASQPSKPLLPQDTLSISNEVHDKEHLRRKRYQVDETYAFPMENRLLQRAETDENNGFEVDNNIDMEFVPNNMGPNEMYPMENFGDQDPNIPRQDYPVIGSPLYPQSIQDDNSQYPGYRSLMNDARSDEELRLPVHTEERDFGRQSWKDMNIYGFNQGFTLPQDSPRINPQEFLMNNGQVTYSYLETPIPQTTTELPHDTTPYRADYNAEMRNHESTTHNENSSEVVTVISDKTEEATRSTTSTVGTDDFDATDSIESIENIRANNESVLLEIGKTKIVVSKADDKSEKLNGEINTTERNEVTTTSDLEKEKDKELHQIQNGNVDSFRSASQKGFQLVNEDIQSSQNVLVNPNICQYAPHVGSPNRLVMTPDNRAQIISMVPPGNFPKPPFYVMNPSVYSYMPPSPVIPHYGPISQQYNPYAFMNPLAVAQMPPMAAPPVQMSNNNNGQVYLCNPAIQTPNIQPLQPSTANGIEIRSSSNLQDTFDKIPKEIRSSNKTRDSLNCPINEQSCLDGSKCISVRHFCDNEVHCEDGSDETFCSCRERIAEIRLCDGYFDCPDGEDETGCFGCSEDEINCDDWSRFRKGTCVPMNQRCDGIRHCEVTGKDEDDCSILTDQVGETNPMKISNAAGFLHRNYKGKWYPTCFGSEIWALDVCKVEAGPSSVAPLSHQVLTTEKYEGEYISLLPNKDVRFEDTCVQGRAAFVECPPLFCGLRMTIKNPYRPQELDTSIEDMMNHLNRQDYTFGDDSYSARKGEEGHNRTKRAEDFILGGERVVGGKASQPAAWPWVVSIYKNGIFHCGGVIINELWVLTAAHCIDKYWLFYYEIQAGILRRFSYSPMEQFRWVVAAIAHEQYDKSNLKNDIALMRLSSALRYNRYVRPICLPSETTAGADFRRGPAAGTICTTVGWGATIEHGTDPDHMREVDVPILKNCKHPEDIEGQEICAGLFEGGKDACQGDSGGPFMCQNPNNPSQWYLAGIVSHGEGCARPNEPGVYTRVSLYIDWIADNMREENFFSRMPLQKCPGYICKGTNKCIPKKRHCDKVVDCLMGDDEVNCRNTFHNIFKFSGDSFMNSFLRSKNALETEEPTDKTKVSGDILGAVLIESDSENSTVLPIVQDTKPEKGSSSQIVFSYEKRIYYNNNTNNPDYFRCEELLQMIPIRKRCNKMIDCEDGTDEKDCKCVDYLKLSHPDAICDGVVDCKDSSDESFCFACREEEFNCRKSRTCVSKNLVCDGKPECDRGEDEMDCVALTDGKTLVLDNNNRPNMSLAGVVSVNQYGIWRPLCNTSKSDAEAATNSCNYLGFGEYTGFKKIKINNRVISVRNMTSVDQQVNSSSNSNSTCDGLYVWCSDINHDSGLELSHKEKMISLNETFEAAWNAAIFSDGIYKCMGVILNEKWILTSLNCFHGILHFNTKYLAVLVGKGSRYLDVPGPNDSILKVSKSYRVLESDVVLLRLENVIKFNRYVQPTHLNVRTDKLRKERCVAVGMKNSRPSLVFLETKSNCSEDHTCISAASDENCLDGPWSGVVTCFSGNGWYPAAVFSSFGKSCPFEDDANFTSVRYLAKDIKKYTDNMEPAAQESFCDGFRCDLGNCIDVDMICDGLPQCLGGEDETTYFCEKRQNACSILKNCVCPVDHLTCSNGKCVHKSKFCDRVNDCGDYSDEPPRCTCRSFMKLTHPERVCDGHVNCFDGSDENPRMCQCKSDDFVCNKSKLCISNEMVCNGFVDCPDGEDEKECYSLAFNMSNNPQSGAVLTKSAGLLFESCYSHSPSTSELDNICQNLGFGSCKSHSLRPYANGENATLVPVIDTFDVVWVRREGKVPLLFRTRTGNDAYLTFRKRNNCQQLHIECI